MYTWGCIYLDCYDGITRIDESTSSVCCDGESCDYYQCWNYYLSKGGRYRDDDTTLMIKQKTKLEKKIEKMIQLISQSYMSKYIWLCCPAMTVYIGNRHKNFILEEELILY